MRRAVFILDLYAFPKEASRANKVASSLGAVVDVKNSNRLRGIEYNFAYTFYIKVRAVYGRELVRNASKFRE